MHKFFHHYLLPHQSNNHRAKLLHHQSLLVVALSLIGLSFLFSFTVKQDQSVLGISYSVNPEELLILTNQKRQELGLAPLVMNEQLADAARRKASDMFIKNYWSHIAPDGTTPWYFIKSAGYEYVYAGENLARGFYSSPDVINAWMASPSHRENMLSPNYQDIGFAIQEGNLTGDDTVLVVEELGNRTRVTTQAVQEQVVTPTITDIGQEVSPTVSVERITPTPTALPILAVITPVARPSISQSQLQVAAFKNDPLVNKPVAQKNIAAFVLIVILILLIVDIIIIRRKRIARILSHNMDHIIFFSVLLLIILLLTRGGVL